MKQTWKKALVFASVFIICGGLLLVLIETFKAKNTGFETKTLWDWLELLIIPFVLSIGAFYLNRSERAIERQTAEARAKLEREIATDRQQEASLQSYLDRMSELLINENFNTSATLRNVARIRTLTVLRGLDEKRKGLVLLFLQEAKLIHKDSRIINLSGADLQKAYLWGADLHNADLEQVNLQGANLASANLDESILTFANLEKANLYRAYLRHAIMRNVNLENANLSEAHLSEAQLTSANLKEANLENSYAMSANLRNADITKAKMRGAFLDNATMPDGTTHD